MNSKISNYQHHNYNTIVCMQNSDINTKKHDNNFTGVNFTSNPINTIPQSIQTAPNFRAEFVSKDEQKKYTTLLNMTDKNSRKNLEVLFKKGVLLNSDSNDSSSVLDNLYKIATTERARGLSNLSLLSDTINTLANPFIITQQFGDIPSEYRDQALKAYCADNQSNLLTQALAEQEIDVPHSGTCVASSIEFNLAKEMPAEFTRFVEGLTSPNVSVEKTIKLKNLADNTLDAIWLLNAFEVPYKSDNFDEATLKFAPDKNALLRAQIQTTHRDPLERSPIDVLMQSTLMQIGSQQSYNSLSDKRAGKFNQNDKGLIEFEKTFTESVVEDKNKLSITYQKVDENARLVGYETDFNTMKKHILQALNMGENVIIGYTQVDPNNVIINGHEITIVGTKQNKDGTISFICNDTDDNISKPIEYNEKFLLPKIHHAALPESVLRDDINMVENWVEGLNSYKEMKRQAA